MWWNVKLIHMWRNFRYLLICHVQKFEFSPHDRFFLHGHRPCVRDKYQVWVYVLQGEMEELRSERTANSFLPFHSAHLRAAWLCIKIIMVPFSARLSSSFLQQLLSGFQTLSSPFARPTACIKIIMVLIPRRLFLNFLNTGYISFQANTPTSGWNPEHKINLTYLKKNQLGIWIQERSNAVLPSILVGVCIGSSLFL